MTIELHTDPKGVDWYCYDDTITNKIIVGRRGDEEMKIDRWDWFRAEDSFRLRNGRNWTPDEAIAWAIKYTQKESEYVEFEEIKPEVKLLSE